MGKGIFVLVLSLLCLSVSFFAGRASASSNGELDSRSVDITFLLGDEVQAKIIYTSRSELANQVNLGGVKLEVEGRAYFPEISVAAFQDEALGSAICKLFGFGRGVLGSAIPVRDSNSFSMNSAGEITSIVNGGDRFVAATSEVICQRY